jgi:dTDP-4-dehydrorhamnose 3,5-epimerase
MQIKIETVKFGAVALLVPEFFEDERGFFVEEFRADQFGELGLPQIFVQENHSGSVRNVLRGLHFQWDPPMGKLMRVLRGEAFLVAVDIRKNSPYLGHWYGVRIRAEERKQLWAPAGFARGFCVLSEYAEIQYLCTGTYNNKGESGILWNDPEIGIEWPLTSPILSDKDSKAQTLAQWHNTDTSEFFMYDEKDSLKI